MLALITHPLPLSLPLEDPILKFMLIMAIVLGAPLLLNKLRIPYLLGLIIAGAVIGPHGLNLVLRDSSIILSGTAGLLYIMFLSGLEIDIDDFRRNSGRSLVFGLYTFLIPMAVGIPGGYYILGFSLPSSILLAALFASQTLIAYPIVSKLGITRDKAVTIAVGGTVITDMLALLVLTVVVGLSTGSVGEAFWYRLGISIILCIAIIAFLFPLLGRWFFKQCSDSVSQYVFVLVMVFLGAYLAQLAGLEPIIGAFLSGLAMNRLIPRTSALMNRVEFVGNAIFIPFFLIGVGMLIDYRAFFRDWDTLKVSAVMIVLVTGAKFAAAMLTQKSFRLTRDQRTVLFGLSSAHVAATLAAVMVGYNVILGHTTDGEPIRLLNESVLNGTILMILATCTVSTFATQQGAHRIALKGSPPEPCPVHERERILIPVSNRANAGELIALSTALSPARKAPELYALSALDNRAEDLDARRRATSLLETAATAAAATDNYLHTLLRYDVNIVNAITSVVREHRITDLVMGMHQTKADPGWLGRTISELLHRCNVTTLIYQPRQPLQTLRRHVVIVPRRAEQEAGFQAWLRRVHDLIRNTGARLVFHAPAATMRFLRAGAGQGDTQAQYLLLETWDDLPTLLQEVRRNDCLWLVMSRRERISYQPLMSRIPALLAEALPDNGYVLVFPEQAGETDMLYTG